MDLKAIEVLKWVALGVFYIWVICGIAIFALRVEGKDVHNVIACYRVVKLSCP
jgi:hypothetical protein